MLKSIIIKKDYVNTIAHIVIFGGIIVLGVPYILYDIAANGLSRMSIFWKVGLGLLVIYFTGRTVLSCILFGMKECVINNDGITYCNWKIKQISWKEIKKVKLESSQSGIDGHSRTDYELAFYTESKRIEVNANSMSLKKTEAILKICKNQIKYNRR
ncbi:hypothetical protein [uncultured Lactococcus sp.]|uniref:hypothetical protein n=1 Tax=uncultured Lactococcus sp. TaxID=167973 RepID=UPI0027DE2DE3|nr:hypothetical protein [uncultured Lactococcus sp.]